MSQTAPQKRYGLFSLAIALGVLGIAGGVAGYRNFTIRSLGLIALMFGAYLVRISNVHASPASAVTIDLEADTKAKKVSGRLMWVVGIALLPMMGVSYLCLHEDALHGYHEAWPVYMFAGVGLACAVVWPYLVSKKL